MPVVGAGLSLDAGLRSFSSLVAKLAERARRDGFAATLSVDTASPFDTVDQLAAALGDDWLQDQTASIIRETVPRPTPALMAIGRVASGLVVTTNYDDTVERAAAEVGRPVVTLTSRDLREALTPGDATLRVLHLHGVSTDPSSIVLSSESYSRVPGVLGQDVGDGSSAGVDVAKTSGCGGDVYVFTVRRSSCLTVMLA